MRLDQTVLSLHLCPARSARWLLRGGACLALLLAILLAPAMAQHPNACDVAGEEPDIIVGDLHQVTRYGTVGSITGYAVGTVSCNTGTCWANWFGNTNQHPVIAQNMYRLKDDRFEQIGQSWVKHGFFALSQELCSSGCVAGDGSHLGVNCSDPYSANLNADQTRLGPRSEVNPSTGEFPYPFDSLGDTGNAIYKRLQVHNVDLDPNENANAAYFVEGQYITEDDAAAENDDNNASHRQVLVSGSSGVYELDFFGDTVRGSTALAGWKAFDPSVGLAEVKVPDDGQFLIASRVTDLGGGMWNYEYAVQNVNSHRSGGSFRVPVPLGALVQNIGFHDVDYHSGEPYDGTDWAGTVVNDAGGSAVVWSTETFDTNPDANALRWGTLYNFRFDTNTPPVSSEVTVGLFRPGDPLGVTGLLTAPSLCNNDGICEGGETCDNCADCLTSEPVTGTCGDGICEPGIGEDCVSCSSDCNGRQGGNPSQRFCCGDGDGDSPVSCNDSRCTTSGFQCGSTAVEYCCGDGTCDPLEDSCICRSDCGPPPAAELSCTDGLDEDCDGEPDCTDLDCCTEASCIDGIDGDGDGVADCDCDDTNNQIWATPGEARSLELSPGGGGGTTLDWLAPTEPGAVTPTYDLLRSADEDFAIAECVSAADPTATSSSDADLPAPADFYYYLVRAVNECPVAMGGLGSGSSGALRPGSVCP